MKYSQFEGDSFRNNVDEALRHVNKILQTHRNPRLADDVEHNYGDKYDMANLMTNLGVVTQMNCLEKLGLTAEILKNLDKKKSTTLRFQASDTCTFLKENEVEIPMEKAVLTFEDTTTQSTSFFGGTTKATITRVVNRVKEYHWKIDIDWEISIYSGTDVENKAILQNRKSSTVVIVQSTKEPPIPAGHREHPAIETSLTELLQEIDTESMVAKFKIDTTNPTTKTPSRNKQVEVALDFMSGLKEWAFKVERFIRSTLENGIMKKHNPALGVPTRQMEYLNSCSADNIFNPIQPLMEEQTQQNEEENDDNESNSDENNNSILGIDFQSRPSTDEDHPSGAVLFSKTDLTKIINEHIRSLEERMESIQKSFPSKDSTEPISEAEAGLVILCGHMRRLHTSYSNSMLHIERMLEQQLIAAIGKRVNSSDLDKFVRFHNGKLLHMAPKPFCHSVRRPNHYPDGVLSIEGINSNDQSDKKQPIDTFVREVEMPGSLKMSLNAAATLELTGKAYLHGWLQHRFGDTLKKYELIARARQFSSFMLVVGTMTGSDELDPKDAIILQNKDEVIIPLLLDELPSAKEFKDAIKSLSPEQQRFAKSFRSMQLESSVLGVCIIQIKPQLECLLNLPCDALTKEMKLTQDLMELFIEYQVPSDLLSYDGEEEGVSVREKVGVVKGHVSSVLGVVDGAKKKQLEEETKKAEMAAAERLAKERLRMSLPINVKLNMDDEVEETTRRVGGRGMVPPAGFNINLSIMPSPVASSEVYVRADGKKVRRVKKGSNARDMSSSSLSGALPQATNKTLGSLFSSSDSSSTPKGVPGVGDGGGGEVYVRADGKKVRRVKKGGSAQIMSSLSAALPQITNTAIESPPPAPPKGPSAGRDIIDFTTMPKNIDFLVEKHDSEGSLRSTVIKTANNWTRLRQETLLSKILSQKLSSDGIKSEKNKAFDLLDALSRSGSLSIACSELHVIICLTHRFEKDVMGTLIKDNNNPIEKLERSTILFASTIHGVSAESLVRDSAEFDRLADAFPMLFLDC